jgi:hypothetical protein
MRPTLCTTIALFVLAACAPTGAGDDGPVYSAPANAPEGPDAAPSGAPDGDGRPSDGGAGATGPNDAGTPKDSSAPKDSGAAQDASTSNDAGAPDASSGSFDAFQKHNLDVVNQYRATLGIAPLVLDAELGTFAKAGSVELSQDHTPHKHMRDASDDGSIWSNGFSTKAAENQGDANGWNVLSQDPTQNEMLQIDAIQEAMFDEGPGPGEAHGHYTNMMDPALKRLGVGLLEVNGQLYLTNDFSD